jgi:peptide/nickel transport system permease protein
MSDVTALVGASGFTDDDEVTSLPQAASGRRRRVRSWGIASVLAIGWLSAVVVLAAIADLLPLDPETPDYLHIGAKPFEGGGPLGTDLVGRDMVARIVFGARPSLLVGISSALIAGAVGTFLGLCAGYFGGVVDRVLSWLTDLVLSFPGLVLLLIVATVWAPSIPSLIFGLSLLVSPVFLRVSRGLTKSISAQPFVTGLVGIGVARRSIVFRHIAPMVLRGLLSYFFVVVSVLVVAEGSLSFLGLGVQAPTPSWGAIVASGRQAFADTPHIVFVPSIMIFLTVVSLNILGERFRQVGQR